MCHGGGTLHRLGPDRRFGQISEPRRLLDQNRTASGLHSGDPHGPSACEGIEHQAVRRNMQSYELSHQLDGLGRGVPGAVSDSRDLEDVLLEPEHAIFGKDVRGPTTCGVRLVDLLAVEIVGEDSTLAPVKSVRLARLLEILLVTPWNPSLVEIRDKRLAGYLCDEDGDERRAHLAGRRGSPTREDPHVHSADAEACHLDAGREPVVNAHVRKGDQEAPWEQLRKHECPELGLGKSTIPGFSRKQTEWWVSNAGVAGLIGQGHQDPRRIAADDLNARSVREEVV